MAAVYVYVMYCEVVPLNVFFRFECFVGKFMRTYLSYFFVLELF